MKLIITATSPDIDSQIDPRFGRASYFLVVNPDTLEWQAHANPALTATGGAGIKAAQFISAQDCTVVISGDFGPNAYEALDAAGIPMYLFGSCRTVRQAIQKYEDGQLERLESPTKARGLGRQQRR